MKKRNFLKLFVISAITSAIVFSCEKENTTIDTENQSAIDNTVAEAAFSQIFPIVNEIGVDEEGVNRSGDSTDICASISIIGDTALFPASPVTVVIDFGTTGCFDRDNRFRKGKINAEFSLERWRNAGAKVVVTLENYSVDGVTYEGKMTATNDGNYTFTRVIENGKCIAPDWTVGFAGTHTVQQFEGGNTPLIKIDDAYKFTGNSTGTNRKGKSFTTKISDTNPLIKRYTCKWIESGIFEITPEGLATRTVNYGDGNCDDAATLTINGNTYDFKLMK